MQVKYGVLYLHHPLKHVCQREEGDEHIVTVGIQCALDREHGRDGQERGGTDKRGGGGETDGERESGST